MIEKEAEFNRRLYRYRLIEVTQNIDSNLSILHSMNDYYIDISLAAIDLLDADSQSVIWQALVKSSSKKALSEIKEGLTDAENCAVEKFRELWISDYIAGKLKDKKSLLKKYKIRSLKKVFFDSWRRMIDVPLNGDMWCEIKLTDVWSLHVYIDIQRESYRYSHNIIRYENDHPVRLGPPGLNLSLLMGLYSSCWCFMNEDDVNVAAENIVRLIDKFIGTSKEFLTDL